MKYPSLDEEILAENENINVMLENMRSDWDQSIQTSIESALSLADRCKDKGINPVDVINDLVKIHDKKPIISFKRNVNKLIVKYTCKIYGVDPFSVEGKEITEDICGPLSQHEMERREKKDRIKAGLEPDHMTFYLKEYAEAHPDRDVHYTF